MTSALVLSGGGSLGAVQVGMALALADSGFTPDLVVGTSVGALNAAFIAGRTWPTSLPELAEVWCSLRRADVFPTSPARLLRAAGGRGDHIASDRGLRTLLRRHLAFAQLEDATIPIAVVATDVRTGHEVVLRAGPAADAVLASASLPGILPPVVVGAHSLIDGGLVDNTPISVAMSLGADRIVVLPTGYACALVAPPRGALAMALHAVTLAIQRRLIEDVARAQGDVDLRVAPPLCPLAISPVDFRQSAQLISRAYAQTSAWSSRPRKPDQTQDLLLHTHGPRVAPAPTAVADGA